MTTPQEQTIKAYDAHADLYGIDELPESVAASMDRFVSLVGAGGQVLEIGSGHGRDARELEARGVSVRRTDITPGFVERLRRAGQEADVLDPLVDDLGGPYDGVWAAACLLHVARADLPTVLARLGAATRSGGAVHVSLKEGDGDGWSIHGSITAPRLFVYWREEPLRVAFADAGWDVVDLGRSSSWRVGESWIDVRATRGVSR